MRMAIFCISHSSIFPLIAVAGVSVQGNRKVVEEMIQEFSDNRPRSASKSYGLTWKKACNMSGGNAVRKPSRKLPPAPVTAEKSFDLTLNGQVGEGMYTVSSSSFFSFRAFASSN